MEAAMSTDLPRPARLVLMMAAVATLLAGIVGGLLRLGWIIHAPADLAALHGPLMICGAFGTLIGLERAVAMRSKWVYAGPVLTLAGTVILFWLPQVGIALMAGGAAVLLAACFLLWQRHTHLFNLVLTIAAACWLTGLLVWCVGSELTPAVPWWVAFLTLTIAGERLELTRLLPPSAERLLYFRLIVLVLLGGLVFYGPTGWPQLFGMGLVLLAFWLMSEDVARRTLMLSGQSRYIAICLLSGYVWLALGGAIMVFVDRNWLPGAPGYDASLHALMVGFVMSMVFGHAPIILPALTRLKLNYHDGFYLPLGLLHLSLLLRVGGDALADELPRRLGGAGNALALLAFAATILHTLWRPHQQASLHTKGASNGA
jgi:hypothetical protein